MLVFSCPFKIPVTQGKAAFYEISGVAITVWSEQGDFAAVGFIVDQIDALISEWYPGEFLNVGKIETKQNAAPNEFTVEERSFEWSTHFRISSTDLS